MDSKLYKAASRLYNRLLSLKLTIEALQELKNQRISKAILVINNVKNPVVVTGLTKEISNKIVDLLLEHKIPIYNADKKEFKSL